MHARFRRILPPNHPDGWIAVLLFLVAAAIGMAYVSTWGGEPVFQQSMYGPAAMWACGRGFENPMLSKTPALEDFLYLRSARCPCEGLPKDLPVVPQDTSTWTTSEWRRYHPHPDFDGWRNWQRFHFYLLMTVAVLWRILGVSWAALIPLYGFFYGVTAAAAYGLFRLAMKRPLATALTVLFILAPLHLQILPHLRDYAKAPFFLSAVFFMGLMVKKTMAPQRLAACSAVCGLIVGIGIGFRQDVLMCAPAFLAVALLFLPGTLRETWRRRIGSIAIFAACVAVSGGPILYVLFAKGNNSSHDTLIGTVKYCDQRLGVGSPLYDLGDPFLDEYTRAVVESYHYRVNGNPEPLRHYTAAYDRAASDYFLELAKTLPADFAIRAYASVLRILDEVRPDPSAPWPPGVTHPALKGAYRLYEHATRLLLTHGRYCTLLALLLLAARSPRMAFCALFLVGWLAGYPALRFSIRHCFHLQLIPFWMAGFVIQRGLDAFSTVRSGEYRRDGVVREYAVSARRAGICLVASAAVIMASLWILRAYQQRTATALFRAYERASTAPLTASSTVSPDGSHVLFEMIGVSPFATQSVTTPAVNTDCWVVELSVPPGHCVPLTLKYEANDPLWDFTRVFDVCPPPTASRVPTKVYLPVYTCPAFRFRGIQISSEHKALVKSIRRLTNLNAAAILIPAALYPGWQNMPLHYSLTR